MSLLGFAPVIKHWKGGKRIKQGKGVRTVSGFTRPGHSRSLRGDRAGIQSGSEHRL